MSKILKTAAVIVGAVALISTGIGAAAGAGLIGAGTGATATFAGISAATFTTIGTIGTIAAGALSLGSALLAKKPSSVGTDYQRTGSPEQFTLDPNGPLPVIFGRFAADAFVTLRRMLPHDGHQPVRARGGGLPAYRLRSV